MQRSKLFILTIFLVMITTFAYSALATNLAITGEANFRAISDIRVTDIDFEEAKNGATLSYDGIFTKDTITNGFVLPNANSEISYNITIKNKGTIDQAIYDLQTLTCNNNNMIILIDDKEINEALPMIVPFGTSKTIKITYKTTTPSNDVINIKNKFIFKEVYYITYNTKGGTSVAQQIKYHDVPLTLEGTPTKSKYVFTGWTDEQNGTTVKYNVGSSYTENSNKIMYAIWRTGEATFLSGHQFAVKIKRLAGDTLNQDYPYLTNDANITSIVRANALPQGFTPTNDNIVSTQDSDFPIYAWYDNHTLYYYTVVDNPYMNQVANNMFRGLTKVKNIDLSTINTSRTKSMHAMFMSCLELTTIDLSNFDTRNVGGSVYVEAMTHLFHDCRELTSITFGNNFITDNVFSMNEMFEDCRKLKSLNLSNFNTSKVTDMSSLFNRCYELETITLGNNFTTSNVTTMYSMFNHNYKLTSINLSNFNTSKVTNMKYMFIGCSKLTSLDISSFNMSAVTDNTDMLYGMSALRQLKTPNVYPSNLSIELPNTFYDTSNNAYTTLATGNPTQTWIKLPYTIKFNANNGTGTMNDQKIGVDATTTLTTNAFTRTGYTFAGWNTQANGQGTAYLNNASVTNLGTYNDEITLYAQWTVIDYIVTVDANGGSISSTTGWTNSNDNTTSTKSISYDSTYGTLPTPTRTGYTFKGWSNTINSNLPSNYKKLDYIESTGTQYIDTGYIPKTTTKLELDLSFNGDFKDTSTYGGRAAFLGVYDSSSQVYAINFGASDSQFRQLFPWVNKQYQYDGQQAEPFMITNSIKTNRNTLTIENGEIIYGTISRTISNKETNQDSSMYLFGLSNNISSNKGPFTSYNMRVYDMKVYENNVLIRHYIPVLNTTNHKLGLYETENNVFYSNIGTGEFNAEYTTDETINTTSSNHTLYAIWEPNKYNIVFDKNDNDAIGTMDNQTVDYDKTFNLPTNTFTKTGYTFTGWNTQANGQGTPYLDGASVSNLTSTNNDNITLYAQWIANQYTVTFDYDGATTTGISSKQVTYDSTYGTLPEPTKEGYDFKGWNGKNKFDYEEILKNNSDTVTQVELNGVQTISWKNDSSTSRQKFLQGYFKENVQYTITGRVASNTVNRLAITIHYTDGTYSLINYEGNYPTANSFINISRITAVGKTVDYISGINSASERIYLDINSFQIEEGTSATIYETPYVTSSTNVTQSKNHTLKAIWEKKKATFDTGQNFNAKIKKLSGTNDATYSTTNTNITSIQRVNSVPQSWINNDVITPPSDNNVVSTSASQYPIYAWYDNGTIYYYTEALNPYMNTNGSYMFSNLRGLTNSNSLNISSIDTSKTTTMNYMFYNSISLLELDLSNFDTSKVTNMGGMFNNCQSLTSLNISSFNTSNVTSMYEMFNNCRNLTNINLSNFDTSGNTSTRNMFSACISLTALDLSNFDMSNVINTTDMFSSTSSLKQLKTPNTYPSETIIDLSKLMIDSNGNEYTTLTSSSPISTWLYKPSTFINGQSFNETIKQLAGNQDATYSTADTNITSIQRANSVPQSWINNNVITPPSENNIVSTSTSQYPIYVWYDNGTIYYYTEALNLYMNSDSSRMFRNLRNVTSIDLSTIKTSKTTNIKAMFHNDQALTSLNLSNFNMSNVTNTDDMLNNMTSLNSLKTPNTYPSDTSVTITLPTTLYDVIGNNYSTLTSTSPTSTWLKKEYVPYTITYDLDGGTVSTPNSTTYTKGSSNITLNNPTKEGYNFVGWSGGNNLFDKNNIDNEHYITMADGSIRNDSGSDKLDDWASTTLISVKPNTTYIKSGNIGGVTQDYFDVNGNFISFDRKASGEAFTTPNNCYFIKFNLKRINAPYNDVQLEEGSSSTPYEPYLNEEPAVTIPSGSTGNRTYKAIWETNVYSITYDLDGGTVSTPNPSVYTIESSNITLNNPTKSGYTFKGWSSGKNLFDEETLLMDIPNATYENGYYIFRNADAYNKYGNNNTLPISNFKQNTQYTFTINGYTNTSYQSIWVNYTDGTKVKAGNIESTENTYIFITTANKTIDNIKFSFGNTATVYISSFQLEEGSSSTTYEPYINEETTVTISSGSTGNRTYKAIWEENTPAPQNNQNNLQLNMNSLNNNEIELNEEETSDELENNPNEEEINSEEESDLTANINKFSKGITLYGKVVMSGLITLSFYLRYLKN